MLGQFVQGSVVRATGIPNIVDRDVHQLPGGVESEDEERRLHQCNAWVAKLGLPPGDLMHELADPDSGEPLAVLDLAWPDGLQAELSAPVAVLIDENAEIEQIVNNAGFRFFTDIGEFRRYVALEILPLDEAAA